MIGSMVTKAFRVATMPARFAITQTRINLETLRALREDYRAYEPILRRAADDTLMNVMRVIDAAERSLPRDLELMTPGERERAIEQSLSRSEQHLLAAVGEIYRSWRIASAHSPKVFENPPQDQLGPGKET